MGLVHGRSSASTTKTQQQALANESTQDRLSGENLKMLLNVIGASGITQSQQQLQLSPSGVQELLEPLEAPPPTPQEAQTKSKQNLKPISNENPNISNSSADIAHEAGFTVVDDNQDDDHIDSF